MFKVYCVHVKGKDSYIFLHVIAHEGQVSGTVTLGFLDIHNNNTAIFVILDKGKAVRLCTSALEGLKNCTCAIRST